MIKYFFPDLKKRSDDIELMDMTDCDEKKLINTVRQFRVINFLFTRSRYLIKKYIISDMLKTQRKIYTFLDIGSGGCDIPIWLNKKAKKLGLNVKITCIDNDGRIIKYAKDKIKNIKEIKLIKASALDLKKLGDFDYIFTNHFLHHISQHELPDIIKSISESTNRLFLINDIYRSNIAYFFYTIFVGIFFHKSFALYDGRISIKKGFMKNELLDIVRKLKFDKKIEVKQCNPARIYVIGK